MRSININEECSVSLEIYCSILDLPENAFSDYSIFLLDDGRKKMPFFHLQIYITINIFLSFFFSMQYHCPREMLKDREPTLR